MSASIRFLGLAVLAWAGVRAASLGLLPGTESLATATMVKARPAIPPVEPTHFAPPPPPADAQFAALPGPSYPAYAPNPTYAPYLAYGAYPRPVAVPFYYPVPAALRSEPAPLRRASWAGIGASPEPLYYPPMGPDPWPVGPASAAPQALRPASGAPVFTGANPIDPKLDRLRLSAWALLRGSPGPGALATGGTLGGSQVGARLTYHVTPSLAASLRSSSSVGGVRHAEVAAGVRWQPLRTVPVALTLERRQALNRWGGRSAFALFAEGGLYQRPIAGKFSLDAYAQGGVVGLGHRDLFLDGGATLTRPVWRNFSAGFGIWGGAQPGLYRVDAGPRLSMQVRRGIRLHADYRQRVSGNAMPSSGPALTIAGDF